MSYRAEDYIKLLIWRPDKGSDRWVRALRSTADYYGWTEEFPVWTPKLAATAGGYGYCYDPGRRGFHHSEGGRRHRISRHPSRNGMPPGFVNAFVVSNACNLTDLAELAHFTKVEWHWMTSPVGERITRDRWSRMYDTGTHRRRGAVSV